MAKAGMRTFSPLPDGLREDLVELLHCRRLRPMIAVPVGRFEEDEVRLLERRRIAEDRRPLEADIPGEDDHALATVLANGHLDAR